MTTEEEERHIVAEINRLRGQLGQNSQFEPGGEERAYRLLQRETELIARLETLRGRDEDGD